MTKYVCLALAFALMGAHSTARAAIMTFSDPTSFLAAAGSSVTTLDFESESAPATYANHSDIAGATFNYTPGGPVFTDDLLVDNFASTTSGTNYLGAADAFAFVGGDALSVNFNLGSLSAVGLYVIGEIYDDGSGLAPVNIINDFTLTTDNGHMAGNAGMPRVMLGDGAAFFIGLVATDPSEFFSTFTLSSVADNYVFNIDDISVSPIPVPAAVWLFGSALAGLLAITRRRINLVQNIIENRGGVRHEKVV